MRPGSRIGHSTKGVVLGLGVTLGLCGLFATGLLDRLYLLGLDIHFRWFSAIPADPRIVLIDIDDLSLAEVDRYPWPRRRYAQLIDTLHELGADRIVLDVVLSEPSTPRMGHAGLDRFALIEKDLPVRGDADRDELIFDDLELAAAMTRAGNVYTGMFFPLTGGVEPPQTMTERTSMEAQSYGAARDFLRAQPEGTWPAFFAAAAPYEDFDHLTQRRSALRTGYMRVRAEQAVLSKAAPNSTSALPIPRVSAQECTFPLDLFARGAHGLGFVSVAREGTRGVVREVPMAATVEAGNGDEYVIFQLGCLVAMDALGIDRTAVGAAVLDRGRLVLGRSTKSRRVPIGPRAGALIRWNVPKDPERWQDSFTHIPAARVMTVPLHREGIADNEKRLSIAWGDLVRLRHAETPAEFDRYATWVNERLNSSEEEGAGPSSQATVNESVRARRATLDAQIRAAENEAVVWLQRLWDLWKDAEPADESERAQRTQVAQLHAELVEGRLIRRLANANRTLEERNRSLLNELEPQIRGKICLVGYTASAVADLVATPACSAMPGVMAHANVINMMLQDRFASAAPHWMQFLLLAVSGWLAAYFTSFRKPYTSLLALVLIVATLFSVGAWFFRAWGLHLASSVAALVTVSVWAAVTLYRQLVAERGRRQFQRALASYTSPAVANRISEGRGMESMAPQPATVTCFFADMADFTRLSERWGPERTRQILNPYLTAMSRVLIHHQAMVNKFMGDGLFAFFNAPIWPCPDHASEACAAALAAQAELDELNRTLGLPAQDGPLRMRIGISTGGVFVGDYGSDTKLDYTCIGDTANLGSRLEGANRVLGTRIVVSDTTRQQADERFLFRRLGRFQIVGKRDPADLHELVGLEAEVQEAMRLRVTGFNQMVHYFQRCKWSSCLTALEEMELVRTQDPLIGLYRNHALACQAASCEASPVLSLDPSSVGLNSDPLVTS